MVLQGTLSLLKIMKFDFNTSNVMVLREMTKRKGLLIRDFNTSNVMVLQKPSKVAPELQSHFNTSNVMVLRDVDNCFFLSILISIHPMLWFFVSANSPHYLRRFHFNTSNVMVLLSWSVAERKRDRHFNTSNVMVLLANISIYLL